MDNAPKKIIVKRHVLPRKTIGKTIPASIRQVEHTPACRDWYLLNIGAIEDWRTRWPRHCKNCRGHGGHSYSQNQAPLGSGLTWMEPMFDLCLTCLGEYICPRCGTDNGEPWGEIEPEPCPFCGWDNGADDDDCEPVFTNGWCMCLREEWGDKV